MVVQAVKSVVETAALIRKTTVKNKINPQKDHVFVDDIPLPIRFAKYFAISLFNPFQSCPIGGFSFKDAKKCRSRRLTITKKYFNRGIKQAKKE